MRHTTIEPGHRATHGLTYGDRLRTARHRIRPTSPPPAAYFRASGLRGFGQVGCIYTAQRFEYDWSGVILGRDLVRRGDRWVADRSASFDGPVKKGGPEEFPTLVRHTYKVLLTRGMKGTAVFSTDPETQEFLEDMCR